jgi:hypothetical protein
MSRRARRRRPFPKGPASHTGIITRDEGIRMDRTTELLGIQNRIDAILKDRHRLERRATYDAVLRAAFDRGNQVIRRHWPFLKSMQELRNALVHEHDGEALAAPTEAALVRMRKIRSALENLKKAGDLGVARSKLFIARPEMRVVDLIREMRAGHFSCVPVLDAADVLLGVFSETTAFDASAANGEIMITGQCTLEELRPFWTLGADRTEMFVFVDRSALVEDIRGRFARANPDGRRLAAVFVSRGGREDRPIEGMITPWDVLDD